MGISENRELPLSNQNPPLTHIDKTNPRKNKEENYNYWLFGKYLRHKGKQERGEHCTDAGEDEQQTLIALQLNILTTQVLQITNEPVPSSCRLMRHPHCLLQKLNKDSGHTFATVYILKSKTKLSSSCKTDLPYMTPFTEKGLQRN